MTSIPRAFFSPDLSMHAAILRARSNRLFREHDVRLVPSLILFINLEYAPTFVLIWQFDGKRGKGRPRGLRPRRPAPASSQRAAEQAAAAVANGGTVSLLFSARLFFSPKKYHQRTNQCSVASVVGVSLMCSSFGVHRAGVCFSSAAFAGGVVRVPC